MGSTYSYFNLYELVTLEVTGCKPVAHFPQLSFYDYYLIKKGAVALKRQKPRTLEKWSEAAAPAPHYSDV